jgi:glycerophosphoryl diester phosphodiesterase
MRKLFFIPLLLIACTSLRMPVYKPINPIVAHRGAFKKNGFPENSIASLREAIRLGCAGSEFDVRMSADDSLVVNHDPHYNQLEIEKTTYADLIQVPLSNGEKLPTLREYLLAGQIDNKHTDLVLEIKPSGLGVDRARAIVDKVLLLVNEIKPTYRIVYISFDYNMCLRILEKQKDAHVQYLNGDKTPDQLKADGIRGMDYNYKVYQKNPEWIKRAKTLGIVLNVWTVNDSAMIQEFLHHGFDLITTNEPEVGMRVER